MTSAEEITKRAKSNLAFALACLPKARRADMVTFYAFCRIIDDIADCPDTATEEKQLQLQHWKDGFHKGFTSPNEIESGILQIRDHYELPNQPFLDLIEGCESDLYPQKFGSWEELQDYTYKVACCVGLISIKIFGCTHPDSTQYAIKLGHALQLTNILRDVGEDLEEGVRIYLPINDMARFQYSERDLVGKVHDGRFIAMMNYHAERAEHLYEEAVACIHEQDKHALKAAEAMRKIYHAILLKMKADSFHVFHQRYSLSKPRKLWTLLTSMVG